MYNKYICSKYPRPFTIDVKWSDPITSIPMVGQKKNNVNMIAFMFLMGSSNKSF